MTPILACKAEHVQYGDTMLLNGHRYLVRYIDGPDIHGNFDVSCTDENGNAITTIINGTVTIVP